MRCAIFVSHIPEESPQNSTSKPRCCDRCGGTNLEHWTTWLWSSSKAKDIFIYIYLFIYHKYHSHIMRDQPTLVAPRKHLLFTYPPREVPDFLLLEDRVFIPCISTTKPRDAIGRNMMIRKTQPDTWQGTNVPNPKRPCVSVVLTKQRHTKNGRDAYFRGIYTHFLVPFLIKYVYLIYILNYIYNFTIHIIYIYPLLNSLATGGQLTLHFSLPITTAQNEHAPAKGCPGKPDPEPLYGSAPYAGVGIILVPLLLSTSTMGCVWCWPSATWRTNVKYEDPMHKSG